MVGRETVPKATVGSIGGSVGGIQRPDMPGAPLPPWSVVITDDFIQYFFAPPTPGRLVPRDGA